MRDLYAGDYVCLSVVDEGEGMDPETLAKATTPFFTTKGIGKGTGLGLPMVQGLMAQSGGGLIMSSVVGQGTTAELWLPVATAEPVKPAAPSEDAVPLASSEPLSILAVDDDSLVLMNTALMLEDLGHDVRQASSADEALQIMKRGPLPDIIVTDHAMPHVTGAELVGVVRDLYPGSASCWPAAMRSLHPASRQTSPGSRSLSRRHSSPRRSLPRRGEQGRTVTELLLSNVFRSHPALRMYQNVVRSVHF